MCVHTCVLAHVRAHTHTSDCLVSFLFSFLLPFSFLDQRCFFLSRPSGFSPAGPRGPSLRLELICSRVLFLCRRVCLAGVARARQRARRSGLRGATWTFEGELESPAMSPGKEPSAETLRAAMSEVLSARKRCP